MGDLRKLPSGVTIPSSVTLDAQSQQQVLGVSRQVLYSWRKNHRFPRSIRSGANSYVLTQAVVDWLLERGVNVRKTDDDR